MWIKTAAILGLSISAAWAAPVKVMTSFSIIEDMVKNVGGTHVQVSSLLGPDQDAHHHEFRPADVRQFAQQKGVKALFVNGLGLDPWAQKIAQAAQFKGRIVVVTQGVSTRQLQETLIGEAQHDHHHHHGHHHHHAHHHHDHEHGHHHHHHHDHEHDEHHHAHHHGDIDPHAWQSLRQATVYVDNIEKALSAIDPKNANAYKANASAYKQKMTALDEKFKPLFATLPKHRRHLVTSHEALGYLADDYGLTLLTPMGFSSNAEPSAKSVATVIREIRRLRIPAIFLENVQNPRLMQQIARESGATIGGTLYTDALTRHASTYLEMMQHNVETILKALK